MAAELGSTTRGEIFEEEFDKGHTRVGGKLQPPSPQKGNHSQCGLGPLFMPEKQGGVGGRDGG